MRRQEHRPNRWTDGQTDDPSLPEAHVDSGYVGGPGTGLQGFLVPLIPVTGLGEAHGPGRCTGEKIGLGGGLELGDSK